jgi:hypothetical protein
MKIFSHINKKEYDSWDDLLLEQADGFCVILVGVNKKNPRKVFANLIGTYETKRKAETAAARCRRALRTSWWRPYNYTVCVRPHWKREFNHDLTSE